MDILIIHGNFPGQFKNLVNGLRGDVKHRIFFITARDGAEEIAPEGVEIRKLKSHRQISSQIHHYLYTTEEAVLKGQATVRAVTELMEEGVCPGLVLLHGGMGYGLFLRELLPNAKVIGLFEWYFRSETARHLMENFDIDSSFKTRMRNMVITEELLACDVGVVPTEWQKSQFPETLRGRLVEIFDGIDTSFFKPLDIADEEHKRIFVKGEDLKQGVWIEPDDLVLTYATRGMEPLRGFPEFMMGVKACLKEFQRLKVVIAGRDLAAYSYRAPSHNGSWKMHMLDRLGIDCEQSGIYFTGLMSYLDYRSLLRRSDLHCYFTRDYVTSWSLFEAAACGSRLCISEGKSTDGVISNDMEMLKVNLDDVEDVKRKMIRGLIGSVKPARLKDEFVLERCLQQWAELMNTVLKSG